MTQEEIEPQIAADPDEVGMVVDWDSVTSATRMAIGTLAGTAGSWWQPTA